jgi:DNA ligase-1
MPKEFQKKFEYVPSMAQPYDDQMDPTGWLLMEKYDGVRVFWDGSRLMTNTSRVVIDLPTNFGFPSIPFEGELWYDASDLSLICTRMGHNNIEQCINFLRTSKNQRDWSSVKIIIFDTPYATDLPYEQRFKLLENSQNFNYFATDSCRYFTIAHIVYSEAYSM